ncbi:Fic family protein [Actinoplanes sp. NPDC020271]|uniref:Fic family protein n=1 Tax=Actinoplanes sp. NPDC020271 TaxID=3363896 RepID=UPI0037B53E0C
MTIDPVDPRLLSWTLTWPEVDPAAHPFDPGSVPAVVRAVAPAVMPPPHDPMARAWVDAVKLGLVEHFGRWAAGWENLSTGHSHGGGLSSRWCCAEDSLTTPERTLDAVAEALLDWRSYLEELARRFARYLPLPEDPRASFATWEAAVGDLVATAAARTGSQEAWYGHSSRVLEWFLSAGGVPDHLAENLVGEAIGGRFRSWAAPTGAEVAEVAEALAVSATGVDARPDTWPDTWPQNWPSRRSSELSAVAHAPPPASHRPVDALGRWRRVRRTARWSDVAEHVRGPARTRRDGIAEFFAARQEGAGGLLAALRLVRADTNGDGPLTFARLRAWQRAVLGTGDVQFRTTSAWAKGGRERYGYRPELPEAFDACLAEATDPRVPLPSRAARVYLDVAFFHPFPDGNARSAALALYFVLAREHVVLDQAASLLMTVRPAGDTRAAEAMARHVAALIEQTRRRAELTG